MFKHLLLPTDGSALSEAAVRKGLELAKEQQARVSAIHVLPEFHVLSYDTEMLADTREEFLAHCKTQGEKYMAAVESAARQAGVPFSAVMTTSDHPHEAITQAAESAGCDLIVMASHGRAGVSAVLLGSVTSKVLTHTKVPVLVVH